MRLFYAPTSPFSRKVRIALRDLDLIDVTEEVLINPWTDSNLRKINPLAKVPTLIAEDGAIYFESAMICDYLDEIAHADDVEDAEALVLTDKKTMNKAAGAAKPGRRKLPKLFPVSGPARWQAMRWQGLADGMMAATGRLYADSVRDDTDRSDFVMDRQKEAIQTGITAIAKGLPALNADRFDIGVLSVAVALDYLDFRWPDGPFEVPVPLRAWQEKIASRPSFQDTRHYLPAARG